MAQATTGRQRFGLIILGNSGVGKSFLANTLLNKEAFAHKAAPTAVTTVTEYEELHTVDGNTTFLIFNIPGLIEAKQEQIDKNKEEIYKAFNECTNAVVIYVFGNQNGRIRKEDIVAFEALNKAYPFSQKSLLMVINNMPEDRDADYEGKTITFLREMIIMQEPLKNFCFLEQIRKKNKQEAEQLRETLMQAVLETEPKVHEKKENILIEKDKIDGLMKEIEEKQKEFQEKTSEMKAQFAAEQRRHEADIKKRKEEFEELKIANQQAAGQMQAEINRLRAEIEDGGWFIKLIKKL